MKGYSILFLVIASCLLSLSIVVAEQHSDKDSDTIMPEYDKNEKEEWKQGPNFYGPQAQMMIEEKKEDTDVYQIRVKLPDGFKIPPHWFENKVRLDVLSGVFYLGSGDKIDMEMTQEIKAGGYKTLPPEIHHYGVVEGPTIIKLTTSAPWSVNYVNPEDDPRKKK